VAPLANPTDPYTYLFYSGIFGRFNIVEEGTYNSLLAGYANNVTARNSLVVGMANTIYNTNASTHANYSAAIGNANLINASAGWAIGNGNTLDKNGGINMVAIGTGLLNTNDRAIALGRWNASMGANDLLVIGSGTSATNRNTALTVSYGGEVKIPGLFTVTGASSLAGATAGSLTVTGNTILQGATTAQNLTVSGNSTLQGTITAASLGVTGPSTMAAVTATTLTTTGNTTLAGTSAASLTVTGTTTLAGDTLLQGNVTLAQPQGDISMGIYE
jgi:cytoskeletal protein CcmA (bactofilin family)